MLKSCGFGWDWVELGLGGNLWKHLFYEWAPLCGANNNVDIYFTGHEHNQEHWQTKDDPKDTDHITIGSGGYGLHSLDKDKQHQMEGYGMDLQTFIEDFGFAYIVVTENSISWKFVNCNLETVYEYTRER